MKAGTATRVLALALLAGTATAQEDTDMQPLSRESMSQTRIQEPEAARDRNELSKNEVEEYQQYWRKRPALNRPESPDGQRRRQSQQDEPAFSRFHEDFREALTDAVRGQFPNR